MEFLTLYVYGRGASIFKCVCEEFGYFVGWSILAVYCGSNWGICFMDFYESS
jgi:hypothetical protein